MVSKSASRPSIQGRDVDTGAASLSASAPYGRSWASAWFGMLAIAFVNGVLHRSYEKPVGELRAHQVSCVVLLVLLAPWVWRTERRHPLPSRSAATSVGLLWAAATVTFEFSFGRYVNRDSWAELLNAYDVRDGRQWLFDVIGIAAAPGLARAWQLRRQRRPSTPELWA